MNGEQRATPYAALIAGFCAGLLGLHLLLRYLGGKWQEGIDPVGLGLALVGLSPWIARILDSTKVGGVEVKFREIRAEVWSGPLEVDGLSGSESLFDWFAHPRVGL